MTSFEKNGYQSENDRFNLGFSCFYVSNKPISAKVSLFFILFDWNRWNSSCYNLEARTALFQATRLAILDDTCEVLRDSVSAPFFFTVVPWGRSPQTGLKVGVAGSLWEFYFEVGYSKLQQVCICQLLPNSFFLASWQLGCRQIQTSQTDFDINLTEKSFFLLRICLLEIRKLSVSNLSG